MTIVPYRIESGMLLLCVLDRDASICFTGMRDECDRYLIERNNPEHRRARELDAAVMVQRFDRARLLGMALKTKADKARREKRRRR